jgi:hypothetical protein
MIRVRTLLAVWLTLAVPAAGVDAVAAVPDCASHEAAATSHAGHGSHANAVEAGSGAFQCDCPCGGLDCSSALSLQVSPQTPDHGAPVTGWIEGAAVAGISSVAPDIPFRPPISI